LNQFFYGLILLGGVLLSACVPSHRDLLTPDENVTKENSSSVKKVQGFALVQKKLSKGQVMEAYQLAQAMLAKTSPKDKNAAVVRLFLKKNINPARIRLLRHYKRIARQAKREKNWHKAWVNYKQTAEFSAKPEVFDSNIAAMYLHGQQLRLSTLLKQRRLEDHVLLQGMKAYQVPTGVAKHDVVFFEFAKQHRQTLAQRAKQAYIEAGTYAAKKKWIAAYVLIESHLRLMPDSTRGEALLHTIQKAWMKGLVIPKVLRKKAKRVFKQEKEVVPLKEAVPLKDVKKIVVLSETEIQALIKQHKWSEAQDAALIYQQHQGDGADALLQTIDIQIQHAAEQAFQQGGKAFQQEHIDQAVKLWDEAVQLEPENEEYLDALSRALSLQERLHLLRHQK